MTFNSPIVVRQLQTLERQLAEVSQHREALRTAWARHDPQAARRATCVRLSIAITRRIDVEPDQPLVVTPPRPQDRAAEWAS